MSSLIIGALTVLLVLNCVVLIFLVLIQLPKKDAGAGLAFGGGAADTLFGAGSGNALTKLTKYFAVGLFVLALLLGYAEERLNSSGAGGFEKALQQKQTQAPPQTTIPPSTPVPAEAPTTNVSAPGALAVPPVAPAATGTNAPAK